MIDGDDSLLALNPDATLLARARGNDVELWSGACISLCGNNGRLAIRVRFFARRKPQPLSLVVAVYSFP